ncbi:MAG: type VI secretion system lipoprotein TssJ [Amphritea sp.]
MMKLLILMISAVLLVAGCSSQQTAVSVPYNVAVEIDIADDVNQYGDGEPHSIVLRLYQLTEVGGFQNAQFLDLYNNDRQLLGSSLVDVLHLEPMVPGKQQQIDIDLQRQSRYLAVMAEFADYSNANSKAVIKLVEQQEDQPVSIRVTGLTVSIAQQPGKSWWQIF